MSAPRCDAKEVLYPVRRADFQFGSFSRQIKFVVTLSSASAMYALDTSSLARANRKGNRSGFRSKDCPMRYTRIFSD
jgi:hypothetical protein